MKDKAVSNPVLSAELLDKKFIYEESDLLFLQKNRMAIRETRGYVALATSLHIFVVTTACNMSCVYCQANNGKNCSNLFMTRDIAERAVEIALESPTRCLSFEFQGGGVEFYSNRRQSPPNGNLIFSKYLQGKMKKHKI